MGDVKTSNIETIGYVVHGPKQDFKLEDVVLTEMQDDELLIDMKYSGICHTASNHDQSSYTCSSPNADDRVNRI